MNVKHMSDNLIQARIRSTEQDLEESVERFGNTCLGEPITKDRQRLQRAIRFYQKEQQRRAAGGAA